MQLARGCTDYSAVVSCQTFVHIDIDGIRLHTGEGIASWDGHRWLGLGHGLDARLNTTISASIHNVRVPRWAIRLTLPNDVIGRMESWSRKRYRGKQVTVYEWGLDEDGNLIGQLQKLDGYIARVSDGGSNITVIEASHFPPPSDRLELRLGVLDEMIQSVREVARVDVAVSEKRNGHAEQVVIAWRHESCEIIEVSEPSDDIELVKRAFYSVTSHIRSRQNADPRFLFKYENSRFCDGFFHGRVKITSAKRMESYEDSRRRDVESRKTTLVPGISGLIGLDRSAGVRSQSSTETEEGVLLDFEVEPYFAFCTSTILTVDLLEEFKGSNSIIWIYDPRDFLHRLLVAGREMLEAEPGVCWHGCVSYERHQDFLYYGLVKVPIEHPALMKSKEYEAQQEHRVVWVTSEERERDAAEPTIVDMGSNSHAVVVLAERDARDFLQSIAEVLDGISGDVRRVVAISSFVCGGNP